MYPFDLLLGKLVKKMTWKEWRHLNVFAANTLYLTQYHRDKLVQHLQ